MNPEGDVPKEVGAASRDPVHTTEPGPVVPSRDLAAVPQSPPNLAGWRAKMRGRMGTPSPGQSLRWRLLACEVPGGWGEGAEPTWGHTAR